MASKEIEQYAAYLKAWYELTDSNEPLSDARLVVPQDMYDNWVSELETFEEAGRRTTDDTIPSPECSIGDYPMVEAGAGSVGVLLP